MSSRDLVVAAAGSAGGAKDDYFKNVSLLLSGDGTNGAQNNTFLDSSTNNFTITRNGNTTQGSFSPYGNLWSNYFASSGSSYLSAASGSSATAFGTGDFTIEGWFFATTTTTGWQPFAAIGTGSAGQLIRLNQSVNNSGQYGFLYPNSSNNGDVYVQTGSAFPTNQWVHLALVRNGTTLTLYANGTQVAQATGVGFNFTNTSGALIGYGAYSGDGYYNGYISNFRVVKGTAVYTSAFTPSTTPLTAVSGTSLLTCQSNRFIDNSSNNFTVTPYQTPSAQRFSPFNPTAPYSTATIGGSGYYNGTSPTSLSIPYSANYGTFTGDFTIECWAYEISHVDYTSLLSTAASSGGGWFFGYSNSQNLCFYYGGSFYLETAWQKVNRWSHVAVTRSGSTLRLYIDGTQQATATLSGTISADSGHSAVTGHRWNDTNEYFWNGYITDIRILNGTALYTDSTYTVPAAPLTAISNTQLLLSSTNAGIPDAAMMNDLETVGNAQVSTSVKKYGTGSMYFDGTGDLLKFPISPNYDLGSGDFTVELWFNTNASQNYKGIVSFGWLYGNWATLLIQQNGLNVDLYASSNGSSWDVVNGSTIGTVSTGTWYHIAVCRSSGTIRGYFNGTQAFSVSTSATLYSMAARNLAVGAGTDGNYSLNGYIDDLRITKGYARYTANFTPPAQALPTN